MDAHEQVVVYHFSLFYKSQLSSPICKKTASHHRKWWLLHRACVKRGSAGDESEHNLPPVILFSVSVCLVEIQPRLPLLGCHEGLLNGSSSWKVEFLREAVVYSPQRHFIQHARHDRFELRCCHGLSFACLCQLRHSVVVLFSSLGTVVYLLLLSCWLWTYSLARWLQHPLGTCQKLADARWRASPTWGLIVYVYEPFRLNLLNLSPSDTSCSQCKK